MARVLLVMVSSPYGSDRVYHGLRLASALQAQGAELTVFLMADATGAAIAQQASGNDDSNLAVRLGNLIQGGATVKVCGLCFETRGYHGQAMVEGAQIGSLPELAQLILETDKVLEF